MPGGSGFLERLKSRAKRMKRDVAALYFAFRDARTPWYAKAVIFLTVAYALSPIDIIPDAIPVLGYLDDLLIVPLGVALAIRLVPSTILDECRERADTRIEDPRFRRTGMILVIAVWLAAVAVIAALVLPRIVR